MPPPSSSYRGGPYMKKGVAKAPASSGGAVAGKTIPGGGKLGPKRHRKILKDSVHGVTKPAIRYVEETRGAFDRSRMARRGGVKRISGMIYEEVRGALKAYLEQVLSRAVIYVEHRSAKTVTVNDILHSLRSMGRTLYGFDTDTWNGVEARKRRVEGPSRDRPHRPDRITI
ncbi:Histone H4 [Cladobotryum mycophilum]|uniref:Histone H4 n=1 Tax=Cladobotryum mycophilum TaxID=491253 RepID=A0ABR0T2J1_9HYPO